MDLTKNQAEASNEEEDCHFAMHLLTASVLPMVFKAALELNVLEIIGTAGPGAQLSTIEIVSKIPTTNAEAPVMLDRLLRLLASHSMLTCSQLTDDEGRVQRLYGLAPVCRYFVRNHDEVSLAPFLHMLQDKVINETWYHLKDAVLEGGLPFNKCYGINVPEYLGKDPLFSKLLLSGGSNYNTMTMKKILETYKGFEGVKELVDVGGGIGFCLNMIISKYPAIKGVNIDLPQVIENAPSYQGVKHVGGDIFVGVPKGDTIFMKLILHSWSDENCLKLLKNCYEALPDNGKVIVVDLIIPEAFETSLADKSIFQFDIFTMSVNPGGKERTEKELEALAKEAGFAEIRVVCCAYSLSVVEICKKM